MSSNKIIFNLLVLKHLFNTHYGIHYPTELIWLIISFILEHRIQIKCGPEQTCILNKLTGIPYICGDNRSIELGSISNILKQIIIPYMIKFIDFEDTYIILYDTNNKRHTCQNKTYETLPPEMESFISYLPNTIAHSSNYKLFLCKDNNLYGMHDQIKNINDLEKINFPNYSDLTKPKILQFCYEWKHQFALIRNNSFDQNELYGWGFNAEGFLGLGDGRWRYTPTKINISNVIFFSTGKYHTVAIDSTHNAWVWGLNGCGQLGLGDTKPRRTPQKLPFRQKIIQVACGTTFTMALDSELNLYSWGNNDAGRLGLGDLSHRKLPTEIKLKNIISIACGESHTIAVDLHSKIYVWGSNALGQLGLGDFQYRNLPQLLEFKF